MSTKANNNLQAFTGPNTGSKTIGTSVVQLSTNDTQLKNGVQIIADADNTSDVYVGVRPNLTAGTADATDGLKLVAGASVIVPCNSESKLYLIAGDAAQVISFMSF